MVKVTERIVVVLIAILTWAVLSIAGSVVVVACDDTDGGYPTPQLRSVER